MATQRQVSANRRNGSKGGVKTEEGKLISRLNARKHGIFVSALTEEDSEDLYGIEDELAASLRPVGRLEQMLVEKLALTYLRMQRCARAEAEFHHQTWAERAEIRDWNEWISRQDEGSSARIKAIFKPDVFERTAKLIDLYDARLTNQFLKLLHELERLQRLRTDEDAPWPLAADPAVQADAKNEPNAAAGEVRAAEDASAAPPATEPLRENVPPPPAPDPAVQPEAPTADALPEPAPEPALEQSQDSAGQEDNAQEDDLKKRTQFAAPAANCSVAEAGPV